jgi:LmbE family N-acetylglucosaminyl deacetylase
VSLLDYESMADDRPKSALELAMERLRQKDKEAGVEERPLTATQKAAIAEARQVHAAKVAEREILHHAALRAAKSREEIEQLSENFRRDTERLASERERRIAEIRRGGSPEGRR